MAKRRSGMRFRDMLPNRHYEKVSTGADSTTASYSSFDVIAGGVSPHMAWLIQKFDVQIKDLQGPRQPDDLNTRFQLLTGEQTTLLNIDDDNVVGTIDVHSAVTTSGAIALVWPLSWVGPVLVASRKLTCMYDGSANVASMQSVDLIFTIWYRWVEMDKDTWYEVQQAQGILT